MAEDQKELQLLPVSHDSSASRPSASSLKRGSSIMDPFEGPSLDLQLSISLRPISPKSDCVLIRSSKDFTDPDSSGGGGGGVQALKWQAAEQIRLAAIEKAYAERVRELSRREMEMAQTEFARARTMWERAREEVDKAEKLKERATRQIDSTCMEITCHSCRQKFRP